MERASRLLQADGHRDDVEQLQAEVGVVLQGIGVERRADGHRLIGMDALGGRLAEAVGEPLLHQRHAGLAADQQQLVDLGRVELRVLHDAVEDLEGPIDELRGELLEQLAGEDEIDVERLPLRGHGDEGHVEGRLLAAREVDLDPLRQVLDPLHRHRIGCEVDMVLLLEVVDDVTDHRLVEVQPAEEDVAARRLHLEDAVANLDDRHVEGAAAEVVDDDRLVQALADAVGEGGRGGLVDDPHHLELDHLAGVLHRLPLPVGEVSGHRHHRPGDLLLQVVLGDAPDLVEDLGADLGQPEMLLAHVEHHVVALARPHLVSDRFLHLGDDVALERPAHEALGRVHGVARVELPLALGLVPDELVALVVDGEDGGDDELAPLVGDEIDVPLLLDDRGATVGRA